MDFELHPAAVAELAKSTGFAEPVILAAVREFRDFWLDGPGRGKKRSHWQWRCRKDVEEKHKLGKLQAIAARLADEPADPAAAAAGRARLARIEAQARAEHEAAARELEQRGVKPTTGPGAIRQLAEGIGG